MDPSAVEKDADAEAIFWEVRIDDNPDGDLIFNHYIRVKVFTDRGRVFATGLSSGAMMTNVLLGDYPDVFKAGAAFKQTTSRFGPLRPARTSVTIMALSCGVPPASSLGETLVRPNSFGFST